MTDPQPEQVLDSIRQWMRLLKLRNHWYDPVFEFTPFLPENQGMLSPGKEFDDARPRIFLNPVHEAREQEFIDYFKEKREHQ